MKLMKRMQNWKNIFSPATIYVLIFSAFLFSVSRKFYESFPNHYTWQELFINYEGGFVRRGLLGQLLFLVDSVIPVQIFYIVLYSVLFYLFLYFSYKKLVNVFDPIIVFFIFISPGLFFFNFFDTGIFGRKYLFIEVILLCIAQVCINSFKIQSNIYKNTLFASALFIIGWAIYEPIIFYFPLFAVLLGVAYARQEKIAQWLLITGFLFSVTLLLSVFFSGDTNIREAICAAWVQRYPELTCKGGGMEFVGVSFMWGVTHTLARHLHWVTFGSFFLAILLSAMPLLVLWKAYHLHKAIQELLSISIVLRFAFLLAVLAPLALFLIAIDWGSFLSYTLFSYLFFLYAVFSINPQQEASWLRSLKEAVFCFSWMRYAAYLFALMYMTFWLIPHGAPKGSSYVAYGAIFRLKYFFNF